MYNSTYCFLTRWMFDRFLNTPLTPPLYPSVTLRDTGNTA